MTTAPPPTALPATTNPAPRPEDIAATIDTRQPATPWHGFWRLSGYTFWKELTNPFSLAFAIALPIFMYLMFGAGQDYSDLLVAHGNTAATVLVNMAIYGAIMTTSSMGANVSLERTSGVTRLFALTPLSPAASIVSRVVASMGISAAVIAVAYAVGFMTGASMQWQAWLLSALLIVALSILPATLGLAAGFAVRTDGAFAATSIFTVIGAFGSGMFIPLDSMGEFFRTIAPWTPFSGIVNLVQMPLIGVDSFSWGWVANYVGWTLLFATVAVVAQRRDTGR